MLEVEGVIERAAVGGSSFIAVKKQIERDWEYGRKGILKEAAQGKRVQKPKLFIDPEDYMYP